MKKKQCNNAKGEKHEAMAMLVLFIFHLLLVDGYFSLCYPEEKRFSAKKIQSVILQPYWLRFPGVGAEKTKKTGGNHI